MTVNDHRVDGLGLVEEADDNRSRRPIDHDAVERAARDLLLACNLPTRGKTRPPARAKGS